jgi:enoyl-CoA hydratase/carnithine racemase
MAEYKYCTVSDEGPVRIITLNRPELMNALHSDAHHELETVWDEFAASDDLWLAIITGAGDRAFSAGNDLKAQAAGNRTGFVRSRTSEWDRKFFAPDQQLAVGEFACGGVNLQH